MRTLKADPSCQTARDRWDERGTRIRIVRLLIVAGLAAAALFSGRARTLAAQPETGSRAASVRLPRASSFFPSVLRSGGNAPSPGATPKPTAQPTDDPVVDPCGRIGDAEFGDLTIEGSPSSRAAISHPDLNLEIRGWADSDAPRALVLYAGASDEHAPKLRGLSPGTLDGDVAFTSVHRVNDWIWSRDKRGEPLWDWPATLAGLPTSRGQTVHVPAAGYSIGEGFQVLVLLATERQVTLKYTRDDNVVFGYTVHIENMCVEPSLRQLYEQRNAEGRRRLPAVKAGRPIGRAHGSEILVAIRDSGRFMDPRSRKDWW